MIGARTVVVEDQRGRSDGRTVVTSSRGSTPNCSTSMFSSPSSSSCEPAYGCHEKGIRDYGILNVAPSTYHAQQGASTSNSIMTDSPHRPRPPPNRRRDKVQLSCDPCRQRKLRCDRQHPCGACSRRSLTSSCIYVTTSAPPPQSTKSLGRRQPTDLNARISELESLVVTLMKGQSPSSPPRTRPSLATSPPITDPSPEMAELTPDHTEAVARSPADPGTLNLREFGSSYVQSAHWEAILTKIRGLKEDLVDDSKTSAGSHLFYGPNRHATREGILAAVPPRPMVDRLMALHFDAHIITPCQFIQAIVQLSRSLTVLLQT